MNITLFKPILGTMTLFVATTVLAQLPTDRFRDVNAAGPFPIYIVAQPGTMGWSFNDYTHFSTLYAEKKQTEPRNNLWGGEACIGFVVNEDKRFKNLYFEPLCYRYLTSRQKSGDGAERMDFIYQTASFRIGGRANIFYPITLDITAGVIYYYQQVVRLDRNSSNNFTSIRYYDKSGLFVNRQFYNSPYKLPGYDLKLRLNLIDAVSSSGGLGLYIGFYAAYVRAKPIPVQVFDLDAGSTSTETSDLNYSISIGAVIPLALRVKRIFPKKFKPKEYKFDS